jgi:hypothetical protein
MAIKERTYSNSFMLWRFCEPVLRVWFCCALWNGPNLNSNFFWFRTPAKSKVDIDTSTGTQSLLFSNKKESDFFRDPQEERERATASPTCPRACQPEYPGASREEGQHIDCRK